MTQRKPTKFELQAKKLLDAVKAAFPDAKKFVVSYSGEGDDGWINSFEIDGEERYDIHNQRAIEDAAGPMVFHAVSNCNEGGGGSLKLDLKRLTVARHEYFNTTDQTYLDEEKVQIW